MPEIRIIDTTLRDAHQCLWATRMTTAMMLPVAEKMDRAGFETIDLMSAIQFDADGTMTGAACWRADGTPIGLGGGYARKGVRFRPEAARS